MKKFIGLLMMILLLAFVLAGCKPPTDTPDDDDDDDTIVPMGPTMTGTVTNAGSGGIDSVKVGVFRSAASSATFSEDNDVGRIWTPEATTLTPEETGTVNTATGAYSVTFPLFEELGEEDPSPTFSLVAWDDADNDGKLDLSAGDTDSNAEIDDSYVELEYNTFATQSVDFDNDTVTEDYFFSDVTWYPDDSAYRFKYYLVSGTGDDMNPTVNPDDVGTTGFNFNMNF